MTEQLSLLDAQPAPSTGSRAEPFVPISSIRIGQIGETECGNKLKLVERGKGSCRILIVGQELITRCAPNTQVIIRKVKA